VSAGLLELHGIDFIELYRTRDPNLTLWLGLVVDRVDAIHKEEAAKHPS
jgi:hypothetical protein